MAKELYVGHLSELVTEEDVWKLFSVMGTVTSVHLIIDPETGEEFLTPLEYPILILPLRIQQQKLSKKMSIPKDNSHIDDLTNQPTTESKGASISYPEVQIIYAMGGEKILEETLKVRGGDDKAFRDYNNELIANGGVTISSISSDKTKVKSTKTVATILKTGMHLDNNL